MKIYLVTRIDHVGMDEYDAFVVQAETREEALELCQEKTDSYYMFFTYANAVIKPIGHSNGGKKGIILGSFNAG